MATSLLDITPDMTGPQKATVGVLQRTAAAIPRMSKRELGLLWNQLKAPHFLWDLANRHANDFNAPEARSFLRILALFWSIGRRPAEGQLHHDVYGYVSSLAFLLCVHRELPGVQLDSLYGSYGGEYFAWKGRVRDSVRDNLEDAPKVADDSTRQREEWIERIADASWAVRCAHLGYPRQMDKVRAYLNQYGLLPDDIGCTQADLDRWLHAELVEQAQDKFIVCRPLPGSGYSMLDVYRNIAGGLLPLARGVTLAEAGISREELITVRWALDQWLPEAFMDPDDYAVSAEGISSFQAQVMPLFGWILRKEPAKVAVR